MPDSPKSSPAQTHRILHGVVGLTIGWGVASFLYWGKGHAVPAAIIATISGGISFCAFFVPPAHRAIQAFFTRLAGWVGRIMAFVLLVPVFFLFFTPSSWLRRLTGKDPLRLRHPRNTDTYWEPREKVDDLQQYRRQF